MKFVLKIWAYTAYDNTIAPLLAWLFLKVEKSDFKIVFIPIYPADKQLHPS